jgi:hypothetical protein
MGISLRGYAKHRGVTLKAVQKAVARKRIKLEPDGTVDAARADRDWTANSDLAGVLPNIIGGQKQAYRTARGMAADPEVMPAPATVAGDPMHAYLKARAVKETFLAKRAQAEYELLMGKLIEKTKSHEYAATLSQMVKEALLAQPDRLAPILAALDDVPSIHKVLMNDNKAVLQKLSKAIANSGF